MNPVEMTTEHTARLRGLLGEAIAEAERLRRAIRGGRLECRSASEALADLGGVCWAMKNAQDLFDSVRQSDADRRAVLGRRGQTAPAGDAPDAPREPDPNELPIEPYTVALLQGVWDVKRACRGIRREHGSCHCAACFHVRRLRVFLDMPVSGLEGDTPGLDRLRADWRRARGLPARKPDRAAFEAAAAPLLPAPPADEPKPVVLPAGEPALPAVRRAWSWEPSPE